MIENIRLSFQGIWSHKMRSFLTMLGIIIGIAAIIAIVSTIKGTNERIKNNLIGSGHNTVKVDLYQSGWPYSISSESDIPYGIPEITEKTKEKILELDSVENVTCFTQRQNSSGVYYQNTGLNDVGIRGIDKNYFATIGYVIKTGRGFMQSDNDNFRKVVIVDQKACDGLFKNENPIGKIIEINQVPFTVIGLAEEYNKYVPQINSINDYYNYATDDSTGFIYMPKACWPIIYYYDEPENVIVKAKSVDDMENAGQKAAEILNATISSQQTEIKYKQDDILERAQNLQELSEATQILLIWVASISLLVGGIGVMNIMLVSVTERTNEIGLKKAIGARKRTILGQFLTEAAVLTSMGGILGVAAGIGLAKVVNKVSQVDVAISIPAAVVAVAFSMFIGVVFGLLPSVKAANLDPIEALRHE